MNEETMDELQDEETTTTTEAPVESQTETETTTTMIISSDIDYSEGYPDHSDNILHQAFESLGVDLDYVPQNGYQAFTMACSLIVVIWTLHWFGKWCWSLARDVFKG